MWQESWAVVPESDRAQWDFAPLERVGPLRFGMPLQEAVAAMELRGFTSKTTLMPDKFGPFEQQRIRFRNRHAVLDRSSVVAYCVGSMGLTCVVVDALTGPQVTLDGLQLVGRPPSVLGEELTTHLLDNGLDIEITPEGDIGSSSGLGMLPRAQRAGDVLLTRVVFGRPNGWANTTFDCIPAEEWRVH